MSFECHGYIKNGNLVLPKNQLMLRQNYLHSFKDGSLIRETLTRESKIKTNQQVKCHFGLVVMIIRQAMIDAGWSICGVAPNKIMIHEILKKACGGVGDSGECLGLSEMSTVQASQFFENCRDWAATQLHICIPDPDPNWNKEQTNG